MLRMSLAENLLQVVVQGMLAGVLPIYLFARAVILLGAGRAATFPALVPGFSLIIGYLALGVVPSIAAARRPGDRADRLPLRACGDAHSGPAYFPAVCGNMFLMILNFEMSTVASMCMKIDGVAQHLLDAEVEHDAVAAVQFDRVLGDLHDLFGGEHLGHVDQRLGLRRIVVDRLRGAVEQRAHRFDLGRHVGEPQRHRLMLDQDAAALHVVLHVLRRRLEGAHADAEILRRLDDLAGTEIDAGRTHRASPAPADDRRG